jgi:hypothetical protein
LHCACLLRAEVAGKECRQNCRKDCAPNGRNSRGSRGHARQILHRTTARPTLIHIGLEG